MPEGSSSAAPVMTPGPSAPQMRLGRERTRLNFGPGGGPACRGAALIDRSGRMAQGDRVLDNGTAGVCRQTSLAFGGTVPRVPGWEAGMSRALHVLVTALGVVLSGPALGGELQAQTSSPAQPASVVAPRAATMTVGRLHYDGGGDWYANPSSLPNLLRAIRERTGLPVADTETVVALNDDRLWSMPYLHMTGHGNVHFSDADLVTLRAWLLQGGFLHASDNYGMDASLRRELA